ncbi:MAG: hypothetical protein ACREQ5_18455, partial [Candidatus Dormibacteria bacterium]
LVQTSDSQRQRADALTLASWVSSFEGRHASGTTAAQTFYVFVATRQTTLVRKSWFEAELLLAPVQQSIYHSF